MVFVIGNSISLNINFKVLKKPLIIFMVTLILVFNSFIVPIKKAEAAFWLGAIPAGITIGGGAYALGALAVGSVAVGLGIEYGDEINASAKRVWNSSTQLAKDSLKAGMQVAVDTGNTLVKGMSDFWDWTSSKAKHIVGLALSAGISAKNIDELPASNVDRTIDSTPVVVSTIYPEANRSLTDNSTWQTLHFTFPETSEKSFYLNTFTDGMKQVDRIYFYHYNGEIVLSTYNYNGSSYVSAYNIAKETFGILSGNPTTSPDRVKLTDIGLTATEMRSKLKNILTVEQALAFLTQLGLDNVFVGNPDVLNKYNDSVGKVIGQDIPNMRDAGLVLPVNDVLPKSATGDTLTYNPTDQTFANPDGTIYTGEVTYTTPGVNIIEIDGVPYIVTPIDGVPTDIYTGQPVSTTPPVDGGGGTTTPRTFDMRPLVLLGEQIRSKFPFSVPWDVYNLFNQLNVQPVTPVFKIASGDGINIGGKHIDVDYNFDVDFSIFDPIAKIIRWGLILVFDIAIVLALRRLTPD